MAREGVVALLEREVELGALSELASATLRGSGGLLVLEGPAGVGKTRLLKAGCSLAEARGLRVLGARGGELEREFPYGVVRQLFEPALGGADDDERADLLDGVAAFAAAVADPRGAPAGQIAATAGSEGGFAIQHGLYWLAANLGSRSPLLLAIDDLHWADAPSLRWLVYVLRRLTDLPVSVVVALRPPGREASGELAMRIASDPAGRVLRVEPLTEEGVAQVVARLLPGDGEPDAEFCRACREVTGGNPFLLESLLSELAAEGVGPAAGEAGRLRAIGPPAVARSVLVRIARLPASAGALARAVAVLGAGADLPVAAALARLDGDRAGDAADALGAADILLARRPLEFLHPILRTAVYEDSRSASASRRTHAPRRSWRGMERRPSASPATSSPPAREATRSRSRR